jgi:hypothetical protein
MKAPSLYALKRASHTAVRIGRSSHHRPNRKSNLQPALTVGSFKNHTTIAPLKPADFRAPAMGKTGGAVGAFGYGFFPMAKDGSTPSPALFHQLKFEQVRSR